MGRWVERFLMVVGCVALVTAIAQREALGHWLQRPSLTVEILSWDAGRELTTCPTDAPAFKRVELVLKIVPQRRCIAGPWPTNQIQGVSVKKGAWSGPWQVDRPLPVVVQQEPVSMTVTIYQVPIEGPSSHPVEIRVVDRWGQISIARLTPF